MLNHTSLVVFSSIYIFNLLTLLFVIENREALSENSEIKNKIISVYLFFLMTGLPLFFFFFFKIRIIMGLYSSGDSLLAFCFLTLFFISLFVYFNLCKNFVKNIKNFYINFKKVENPQKVYLLTYVLYYNAITNIVVFFFFCGFLVV